MALCGIVRIDELFAGSSSASIQRDDGDHEAVGVVQDFLIGHGFNQLPDVRSSLHGRFGPRTEEAVRGFQQSRGIPTSGSVDRATLTELVGAQAASPIASRAYLTMVLNQVFTRMLKVMSLTTQFEGAGKFGAINRNTDKAGLSFGLIQWAQKPLRLNELLRVFDTKEHDLFVKIFGGGNNAVAAGLLTHTAGPKGGINASGETLDGQFDLVRDPWLSRFRESSRTPAFQKLQVECAMESFQKSLARFQAQAPELQSERAVAFMLDLANQHGDEGARNLFQKARAAMPRPAEADLLLGMQRESVEAVRRQHGDSIARAVNERREAFRTTALLSDEAFLTDTATSESVPASDQGNITGTGGV